MLTTACLLLSFALLVVGFHEPVSCPQDQHCQRALLSGNDVLLECNFSVAQWHYLREGSADWNANLSSVSNIKVLPEGHLAISNPKPSQSGLYHCWNANGTQMVQYEVDFQDATMLYVTHKGLGQKPLENQTLSQSSRELIFTRWEAWQGCNRCGEPGERKRLGYCYIKRPLEDPVPCGLYLGEMKDWFSRLQPELQVEACHVQCGDYRPSRVHYVSFDNFRLMEESESLWLTCPVASIYRPVNWEANSIPLTWHDQLSGQDFSYFLDQSTGGKQLKIFWQATYKCFVEQELMVQFNPEARPEMLEAQRMAMLEAQGAGEVTARSGKADSVLKQLMLMLLVVTTLALVGLLFKVLCPAQGKRSNQILLVK
ncbi:protein FAM187B isoform X1 [Castor canadensis]|uniref:Protein FAM187B isoform X1 n=1 Tax=Castor canadensis TaxID=51338 RepID=A0AC58LCC2_CASCN